MLHIPSKRLVMVLVLFLAVHVLPSSSASGEITYTITLKELKNKFPQTRGGDNINDILFDASKYYNEYIEAKKKYSADFADNCSHDFAAKKTLPTVIADLKKKANHFEEMYEEQNSTIKFITMLRKDAEDQGEIINDARFRSFKREIENDVGKIKRHFSTCTLVADAMWDSKKRDVTPLTDNDIKQMMENLKWIQKLIKFPQLCAKLSDMLVKEAQVEGGMLVKGAYVKAIKKSFKHGKDDKNVYADDIGEITEVVFDEKYRLKHVKIKCTSKPADIFYKTNDSRNVTLKAAKAKKCLEIITKDEYDKCFEEPMDDRLRRRRLLPNALERLLKEIEHAQTD